MCSELADVVEIYTRDQKLEKKDVSEIFKWLKTQPHLPALTELQVILFLHCCYYETETAKTTIEKYFMLGSKCELFRISDEDIIRKTYELFFIGFLPKRTPEDCCVLLLNLNARPETLNFLEHIRIIVMIIILYFHQHGPANGFLFLCDVKDACFGHLFRISISIVRDTLYFLQEAGPFRFKGIHYINIVPVTKHFIALMRPFLKKEIYDGMKLHTESVESLYEYIPRECLPEDFGGELAPLQQLNEETMQNLLKNLDFFKRHYGQRIDESKRRRENRGFFGSFFGRSQ